MNAASLFPLYSIIYVDKECHFLLFLANGNAPLILVLHILFLLVGSIIVLMAFGNFMLTCLLRMFCACGYHKQLMIDLEKMCFLDCLKVIFGDFRFKKILHWIN